MLNVVKNADYDIPELKFCLFCPTNSPETKDDRLHLKPTVLKLCFAS